MLSVRITHIRVSKSEANSSDCISHIKTKSGLIESVDLITSYIDKVPMEYYYRTPEGSKVIVETVHQTWREPYIRSKLNYDIVDGLLNLPQF